MSTGLRFTDKKICQNVIHQSKSGEASILTDSINVGGILLFDKPSGMLSHDVVKLVRRVFGIKAVGHSGTLDPLASGLMVILLNRATKLSDFLLNSDKTYRVKVLLGVSTDTYDADGSIISESNVSVSGDDIKLAIKKFSGPVDLCVPPYSATKYKGKKLYEYARAGLKVPKIIKPMNFKDVNLTAVGENYFEASLSVSKGTYIRSWAHEIGKCLKTGGIVKELRRLGSYPYDVKNAITTQELKNHDIDKGFIPMNDVLEHVPEYYLRGGWKDLVIRGSMPEGVIWEVKNLMHSKNCNVVRFKSANDRRLIGLVALRDNNFVTCIFR